MWIALIFAMLGQTPDEQLLRSQGLEPTPETVIDILRQRLMPPAKAEPKNWAKLIQLLADDDFTVRQKAAEELIAGGPAGLPELRKALASRDAEVVRLARQCINKIEECADPQIDQALLRLIACWQPAGAAEALLEMLPHAREEVTAELTATLAVFVEKEESAFHAALRHRQPKCRAVAVQFLGQKAVTQLTQNERDKRLKPLLPLLEDTSPLVRFQAAQVLIEGAPEKAAQVLVALLDDPVNESGLAELLLLFKFSGEPGAPRLDDFIFIDPEGRPANHAGEWRKAWRDWWTKRQK